MYVHVGRDQDESGSSYYLDLGDSTGRAVKIEAGGWSIVDGGSIHFKRPQGLLPLPAPVMTDRSS